MATKQAAISENLQIKLDGVWHKLSVTVRNNNQIDANKLSLLVRSTVGLWCRAWQVLHLDTPERDFDTQSPCFQHNIEPSKGDAPFVTVWNMSGSLSLTVHSHTDGKTVVAPFFAYQDAINAMRNTKPDMFNLSQSTQTTPQNVTPMPAQTQSVSTGNTTFKAWSRSTIDGLAPGLLGIESGKTDNPNYDKQAIIATVPYDYKAVQFDAKYSLAAYPITGDIVIKEFDGQLAIGIETTLNKTIWIKNRGGDNDYEWQAVTKKLGIDGVDIQPDTKGTIQSDYAVMKLTTKDDAQWKNFYGFFNKPESQALEATGTDGKPAQESAEEFFTRNEPAQSTEPDYGDIPF